ncbi:MAG: ATP-dependent DNA helicase [Betaproteobacteria bacterium]|nr:ATP-dependent DNA helicase [Betaproteobacteria bacterium]MDH5219727.1 ATP-dependent DNA helicase [Betaproteobacteria bacterium]MDH5350474.1 ATP-dependent DNA helicase [Betaproteobacteria bacterium]
MSAAAARALERLFAADGPLAAQIPGYRPRAQQLELARAILAAIEGDAPLVAEAGTGTGKTLAYLVPALLAGGKVIVSTGTKTLQDQLYDRDLPAVRRALASGASSALLKGRANYVCLHRLERAAAEARLASREESAQLRRIERFAAASASGDRAELPDVAEDAPVWQHATSTRDNCLGQECPRYQDCFVMKARRAALAADVVVVNHHLFFADVVLRDEGVAELLPACNTIILDEAHQLPETARLFFGETLSSGRLVELARDARLELAAAGGASPELERLAAGLDKAARDLRLAFGDEPARLAWPQAAVRPRFGAALAALETALEALAASLAAQAERSEGLQSCAKRAAEARVLLARIAGQPDGERVRWAEVFGQAVQLHLTPLSCAELFRRQLEEAPRAWIFTSATLSVGGEFAHYQREMGLEAAPARSWPSPYDFAHQALLYVPKGMPADPNDPGYTDAVVEAALPVLQASGGRAFLLFTTLRALRRAEALLRDRLPYPLLVQGTGSRSALLARFRELGNAVLLGSASFREGVDVRGEALSLVVIDKLPFAPPDDPVLAARIEALRARGGNPFTEFQLPQAILQLKQGAGRLIRDETDRGVLMICDPRLYSRPYGRTVRDSLPPMKPVRELAEVREFFARIRA